MQDGAFSSLPSVDQVLKASAARKALERFGHRRTVAAIRAQLQDLRDTLRSGTGVAADTARLAEQALVMLERESVPLARPVFNLTGTVLHTNLGRALLAEEAIEAASEAMRSPVALEFDLASGKRGKRDDIVRQLLIELTGAEDATVVNNNAAAVLIALNTLASGRESIVSRGELIEIGGAFRMPEIMESAGTRLVEVGTTNRTHLKDYVRAIGPDTALILKVHTSNYRIEGFTKTVSASELAPVAREHGIPLVEDLGSGTLTDVSQFGIAPEPTVQEAVAAGADLVTFSGDKLLGGPQAGFIVGKAGLIARIDANPLKRAVRLDKIRLAALEATLRLYLHEERLAASLPTSRLLARAADEIRALAERLAEPVAKGIGNLFEVGIVNCASQIGSGALPLETLPSAGLAIRSRSGRGSEVEGLAARLRALPRPIIGRIADGALVLDLRCLEDEDALLASLAHLAPGKAETTS